jgi:hypothetical protein
MAFLDTMTDRMLALRDAQPRQDPGVAIVRRREREAPTGITAGMANVRPFEGVAGQPAPEPIDVSDTPARPARMPIVVFATHPAPVATFFGVRTRAPDHHAAVPPGLYLHRPFTEGVNIRRPQTTAYGSQFVLDPASQYALL